MLWKKDETCPYDLEDGIMVDYIEERFVLIVKDEVWTDYEVHAFHHNKINISFLYERVCALFLFENSDSIDTSDASFDIHLCDEAEALLHKEQYDMELYLVDQKNVICAGRSISFDKAASTIIRTHLEKQFDTPYDEEGFDRALMKIQSAAQPFELEEKALVKASF